MKLNNKGFAFSTMLYGTLALIIIILYVILGINQGSNDESLFYGDEIQQKLNECVYEEILLENCYSSHTTTCNPTPYHACLGISDDTIVYGDLIAETLKSKVGVVQDPTNTRRYIYRGDAVNNYLLYSNKLWRIISIEDNGTVRLIDTSFNDTRFWDNDTTKEFANSSIKDYLNNIYLPEISDISKMISGTNVAVALLDNGTTVTRDEYKQALNAALNEQDSPLVSYSMVSLPTIYDYIVASSNPACFDLFTSQNCTSWLSEYKSWTINKGKNLKKDYAIYMPFTITVNGNTETVENSKFVITTSVQKIYPVITLNRNNYILSGNGSLEYPYILR